jgi:hypothetical protein
MSPEPERGRTADQEYADEKMPGHASENESFSVVPERRVQTPWI